MRRETSVYHSADALTDASRPLLAIVLAAAAVAACSGRGVGPLGPEYEYEEDLTLGLDGSATMIVNASVPALVALRGLPLNADPLVRADQLKAQVRDVYASAVRDVAAREHVDAARPALRRRPPPDPGHPRPAEGSAVLVGHYELREDGEEVLFRADAVEAGRGAGRCRVGLTGNEIVAFRLHLPARIRFHNSRYLDADESRRAARGNILTWEQRLGDRLEGKPIAYAQDTTADVMEVQDGPPVDPVPHAVAVRRSRSSPRSRSSAG